MSEKEIRKYAALMKEFDLSGLEITEDNKTLRLERRVQPFAPAQYVEKDETSGADKPGVASVSSPLVGVFYSAPAENAEPFVSIGDRVKKGQVLCIIEAMKLMNEVTSDLDGTVVDICVANGQTVEYGTKLFAIKEDV